MPAPPAAALASWRVVILGIVALAVAMGIGRFAFTPLLPLMLRDGTIDPSAGAEWAMANYGGYLLGALSASRLTRSPAVGLRWALVGIAVTTLAVAFVSASAGIIGLGLRAAAGVFSAWALIFASSWGLGALARQGATGLGAWIYTGVGAGIAVTGFIAWFGGQQTAALLWLELGLLSAGGAVVLWAGIGATQAPPSVTVPMTGGDGPPRDQGTRRPCPQHDRQTLDTARPPGDVATVGTRSTRPRQALLVRCYGCFGFGYIVPATFLPAMARERVDDPLVFGLTWPLFGLAAAASVAAAAVWLAHWRRRRVWALAQLAMAAGTAVPLWTTSLPALAASAILVGGTFMVATMAGLQVARDQSPADPTRLLGRMTVAFATGQIAGPLLVRALGSGAWVGLSAVDGALVLATGVLVVTGVLLWRDRDGTDHEERQAMR